MSTQNADTVRTTKGFDGKRSGVFPPVYIGDWCRWKAVPTEQLIGELRHWADYLETLLNDGRVCE